MRLVFLAIFATFLLSACGTKYVRVNEDEVQIFTEDNELASVDQGEVFELKGEKDELYIIEKGDKTYYIEKSCCEIIEEDEINKKPVAKQPQPRMVSIKGETVRVRSTPTTSSNDNIIDKVNTGDMFPYLGDAEGFYKIDFNGKPAYVSKDYSSLATANVAKADTEDSNLLKTYKKKCKAQNGQMIEITYRVADLDDNAKVYADATNKDNCYFVISKKDYRIYVYEKREGGLSLLAHYPICYAKKSGPKEREGDMKTPESVGNTPFEISEIKDASTWAHDFKDGRGEFLAYGAWFMRLRLNGSPLSGNRSIGIHGSTNNPESVPGQDSEGCIRLRDADIVQLKEKFAKVGTKVFIRSNKTGKTAEEKEAVKKLGDRYAAPKPGNPLLK